MADQYNDQPRHRHPDTQQDQFESRNDGQYGEGSDYYGSQDRSRSFDERGYGRSDDRYGDEYEGDWGRARHDRDDTRSYPEDRDRLREGGRYGSGRSRNDDDARWGTMEGREWGAERHNRMGGGRSGRPNPDPVPPMQGRGRSRGGYDDYGGRGYRDDHEDGYDARGYGGRGHRGRDRHRDRDRGFFDKAGDEVSSWFGDDDAERRRERDHRGRGPSNYKRSNERLMEDACERLTHEPRVDARQIKVTAKDNEITLDGHVSSRFQKREAEDCVHEISGVKHVQNNLRIADHDETSEDPATRGARKQ